MSYQAFSAEDIRDLVASPYREFLRRPGMSLGLYRLPTGGIDGQHPHSSDEVYIVQSGRARLTVEGESVDVSPGSVVSVDRGKEHAFTDISEDLEIIVIFAPPDDPDADDDH
jgi:mannose-6-phosphate isomerase-like protein (cupin superfamily)